MLMENASIARQLNPINPATAAAMQEYQRKNHGDSLNAAQLNVVAGLKAAMAETGEAQDRLTSCTAQLKATLPAMMQPSAAESTEPLLQGTIQVIHL